MACKVGSGEVYSSVGAILFALLTAVNKHLSHLAQQLSGILAKLKSKDGWRANNNSTVSL